MNTIEKTFVMIKPDGVQRGLVGEIIARFERAGLKLAALKMVRLTKAEAEKFYPTEREWFKTVGEKTLKNYAKYGIDANKALGTSDPEKIGLTVKEWLVKFVTSAPVVCMALEGNHAVENARKLVGDTLPLNAAPGTIRGDYSLESADFANARKQAVVNLIHASSDASEAKRELALMFKENDFCVYARVEDKLFE